MPVSYNLITTVEYALQLKATQYTRQADSIEIKQHRKCKHMHELKLARSHRRTHIRVQKHSYVSTAFIYSCIIVTMKT